MKNVHLFPTPQRSRLHYFMANKDGYYLYPNNELVVPINPNCINLNISITSDEEIKVGDWVLYTRSNRIHYQKLEDKNTVELANIEDSGAFKIILTTNQYLIKNDVQAIDDDFLEWFVKNPSCEEVEVEHTYISFELNKPTSKYYKIILPKKNFYCGDKFDYDEQCLEQCETCVDKKGVDYGYLPKEELKQETLEEVSPMQELIILLDKIKKNLTNKNEVITIQLIIDTVKNQFVDKELKWQQEQERMYSEEEVKDMLFEALYKKQEQCCITNTKDSIVREVLKQFKNK